MLAIMKDCILFDYPYFLSLYLPPISDNSHFLSGIYIIICLARQIPYFLTHHIPLVCMVLNKRFLVYAAE